MYAYLKPARLPEPQQALPDRDKAISVNNRHYVNGNPIRGPFPENLESCIMGLGCFWGAERKFWELDGVFTTAVGYAGGFTRNATYHDVCSGMSGHAEVVLIVFDPEVISYESLLSVFWESHDPTHGMRQGNDRGTQYRSVVYAYSVQQLQQAEASRNAYQQSLFQANYEKITTEIRSTPEFFYAEEYHQQYLAKNPNGYCGLMGTGIAYF